MDIFKQPLSKVCKNLFIGNLFNSRDRKLLEKNGIKYILSITLNGRIKFKDKNYMIIHLDDITKENILDTLPILLKYIDEGIKHGILVHCDMGISRSASIIIAWLMTRKNMSLKKAHSYLKSIRPIISPNPGFIKQLKILENKYV